MSWSVYQADCIDFLKSYGTEFDAVVTDPPYALGFMGREWDRFNTAGATQGLNVGATGKARSHGMVYNDPKAFQIWCQEWAAECLRVLKPGGYLLAFGGTRTYHRLASAIEDAGFEIRDSLSWIYGSGFPKSLDVSKAIDKAASAEREVIRDGQSFGRGSMRNRSRVEMGYRPTEINPEGGTAQVTAPATDAAKQWQGWGTALKPAHEPIVMARKPFKSTVASNVLEFGTGGINIDGCRIGDNLRVNPPAGNKPGGASLNMSVVGMPQDAESRTAVGRWPANIILSHSPDCAETCADDCPVAEMDSHLSLGQHAGGLGDPGGASRFFYHAKAGKKERPVLDGIAHPTVKPVDLIRWLVRLVTPPGGYVLDPFAGTGTTAEACELEGFDCLVIEREPDYVKLINQRMSSYQPETKAA